MSGEVVEIRRGAKRAISDVIILADKKIKYKQHEPPSINEASREDIVAYLAETGGWTLINERPFDILPTLDSEPKGIFISTFDTSPLALDYDYIIQGRETSWQKGLDTLARLTTGSVHLGLDARGEEAPHGAYANASGVEKHWFQGAHPAGNVGVQIHHIDPIKASEKVWTLDVQDVITIGELMYKGTFDASRLIAVGGSQVNTPAYVSAHIGANVGELVKDNLTTVEGSPNRLIAGNVLSGREVGADDFLDYRTNQLVAVTEGNYYEMFGWLLPIKPRPTISKTFPNFMFPNLGFDGDTNTHGEKRALVMTGQYEQVLPMNIYPQHLIKAIMAGNYEEMEGLGIYELTEEDLALCEFVCTSKMPLQEILRGGLDMMREQS